MSSCGNHVEKRQRAKLRKRRYLWDSNPVIPRQSLKKWQAAEVLPYHDDAGQTEGATADVESDSSDSHLSTVTTYSTEQFDELTTTLDRLYR